MISEIDIERTKMAQKLFNVRAPLGVSMSVMIASRAASSSETMSDADFEKDASEVVAFLRSAIPSGTYDQVVLELINTFLSSADCTAGDVRGLFSKLSSVLAYRFSPEAACDILRDTFDDEYFSRLAVRMILSESENRNGHK